MKRALMAVLGATLLASIATVAAQTTAKGSAQPKAPVINYETFTGCLQKASNGAYLLADAVDAKGGGMKKSFMLTGVVAGLRLGDHMQKKIEVLGSVGDPTSANPGTPTLIMQSVKQLGGC